MAKTESTYCLVCSWCYENYGVFSTDEERFAPFAATNCINVKHRGETSPRYPYDAYTWHDHYELTESEFCNWILKKKIPPKMITTNPLDMGSYPCICIAEREYDETTG